MKKVTFSVLMILALNATAMAGDNKELFIQAQVLNGKVVKKVTQVQDAANQNQVEIAGGEVLVAGSANLLSKFPKKELKLIEAVKAPSAERLQNLNSRIAATEKEMAALGNDGIVRSLMQEDLMPSKAHAYRLEKEISKYDQRIKKLVSQENTLKMLARVTALDALIRIGYTLAGKDVGVLAIDNAVKDGSSFVNDQVQAKLVAKPDATRSLAVEPSNDDSKTDIDVRFTK